MSFHLIYRDFFVGTVTNEIAVYVRRPFANLMAVALALCATFTLSVLTYLLVERPLIGLKRHFRYGSAKGHEVEPSGIVEPALAEPGL